MLGLSFLERKLSSCPPPWRSCTLLWCREEGGTEAPRRACWGGRAWMQPSNRGAGIQPKEA